MFLLVLTYSKPVGEIDALLPAHLAWLDAQYQNGAFLASGRRVPRTGGVILARFPDRATADAMVATDPYCVAGVAYYEVMEVALSRVAAGFDNLLG